ncbi:hypothetical protein L1N85_10635 [Paenibacillus alkaliterrae]|uniref:hypothetical protein n=1 Tax=Paenibacillus alkaliterrae TaxID=320909 RepID=UPI001F4542E7|nr:hypothetical protein [Paenibacillus alkaliterrae]MCF2938892.1 hypothetical protein [Paenibacillus alkaliterrae]
MKFIDLTGKTFSKWTVKERYLHPTIKKSFFICLCECGTERPVKGDTLSRGLSTNCGCVKRKEMSNRYTTHGHTQGGKFSSEYNSWTAMITRCNNPKANNYHNYGGRGIAVCSQWFDFNVFIKDMGLKPTKKHTIDRVDVNKGYSPENCKWATRKEQRMNQRPRKKVEA